MIPRKRPLRRTRLRAKSSRQRELDSLHKLWREVLIARDGRKCRAEGMGSIKCGGGLQAHHIYNKGPWPALRFDLENGILACASHHLYWIETAPAFEVGPWLEREIGCERVDRLMLKARASKGRKSLTDLALVRVDLEQQLKQLEAGPFREEP